MKTAKSSFSVLQCLPILEQNKGVGVPIVNDASQLVAVLTDGDVRRALIGGHALEENCMEIANRDFFYARDPSAITEEDTVKYVFVPILNERNEIVEFVTASHDTTINPDLVAGMIMAGGLGTRLRPLTHNLPKPLVELDGVSLIERILERFSRTGITRVYVSVNYLAEKISNSLGDGSRWNIEIQYLTEVDPLGTGGALGLIEDCQHQTLLLTNGDVYTELDFAKFLKIHRDSGNLITIAATPHSHTVPLGVIEHEGGRYRSMIEKPTYRYSCNSGIYAVDKRMLGMVPANTFMNMPELVDLAHGQDLSVGVYEMSEYWADIGSFTELEKNHQMLQTLNKHGSDDAH